MTSQLKLRIFWLENLLYLSIDQVTPVFSIPVTSYYVWPQTGAWEQLKLELDSKPWISEPEKINMLNETTNIMNYWRENRTNVQVKNLPKLFPQANVTILAN